MSQFRPWLSLSLSLFLYSGLLTGQTPSPNSGEITVQLIQGLDSATNPRGISQGKVTKSTNPAVPVGTTAMMGLGSDPVNGGYTVKLLRLNINGQMVPAASSDVVTAPDFFNKMQEKTRAKGQPQDAASGPHVFLPERMIVRFSLAAPAVVEAARSTSPFQPVSPPVAPAIWKIQPIEQNGHQATIVGVAQVGNRRSIALFDMKCTILPPSSGTHPTGSTISDVRIPRGLITFPTDPLDCGASLGNDFARLTVGSLPETKNAFCLNTSLPTDPRQDAVFEVGSPTRTLVNTPGVTLVLSLRLPDTQTEAFTAHFDLPKDSSAMAAMMNPCLDLIEQQQARTEAAIIASCPGVPGKSLRKVSVLSGPSLKNLESIDDDSGSFWEFNQQKTKGAVAPKRSLACFYGTGTGILDEHKEHLERKLIPIPSTAISCAWANESATCSRPETD